jgi:uncharacterized protein involved in outer membrane biogenesis
MKRGLRIILVLLLAGGLLFLAARRYLSSQGMVRQVTAHLEALLGAPVKVAEVDVGLTGGTSLGGVELYESGDKEPKGPWLTAEKLDADVSALNVLSGTATPQTLSFAGAAVTLRFDAEGRLLTRLPGQATAGGKVNLKAVPSIAIERSQIVFKRAGSSELVLSGVTARLKREDGRLVLSGAAHNPKWGKWTLHGSLAEDDGQAVITLESEGPVHVTQQMLGDLPFLATGIWDEVRIPEGDTPGRVTFRYDLASRALSYRVELEPRHTHVEVPGIGLEATDAAGKVVIADGLVKLREIRGQAYDGMLQTSADLDFRSGETQLRFRQIEAKDLQVAALPPRWKLPAGLKGRLSGRASLEVRLRPQPSPPLAAATVGLVQAGGPAPLLAAAVAGLDRGQVQMETRGSGRGAITDAYVAGQPTAEPIGLVLHAVPGGFRFRSEPTADLEETRAPAAGGLILPLLLAGATLWQDQGQPTLTSALPAQMVNGAAAIMVKTWQGALRLGSLARALPADQRPQSAAAPPYLDINLHMEKVDLGSFVRGLGLTLPFRLEGRLSFRVQARIPTDTSGDLKTYRVQGSATVTDLALGELHLASVRAEMFYSRGVIHLQSLQGVLATDSPGTIRGTARLPLSPLGDLTADLTLDCIPLDQVAEMAGAAGVVRGEASGILHAEAPGARLQEIEAWTATGKIVVPQARAEGLSLRDSSARVLLAKGVLSLADVRASVEGAAVAGSAQVRLAEPFRYSGQLETRDLDLKALERLAPAWRPPLAVAGHLTTTCKLAGTLHPFVSATSGTATASSLKVGDFPLRKAHLRWDSDADRLTVKDVKADLYGGTVAASVTVPLRAGAAQAGVPEGHVQIKGVHLGRLRAGWASGTTASPLQGRLDLDLTLRPKAVGDPLEGKGHLVLAGLRWHRSRLGDLESEVMLSEGQLRLRELTGSFGQGSVRGQLVINLREPERGWLALDLDRVDAADLLGAWLGTTDQIRGPLEARVRGSLGATWRGSADIVLGHGYVHGVEVMEWRLPLRWEYWPDEGRGQATVQESSAQVARGRATGRAVLRWGDALSLEGQVRFRGVDLETLLRHGAGSNRLGSGQISGHFDFAGSNIHSLDDVTGRLDASLSQTQALQFPVFRQLSRFLGASPSTTFERGSLKAHLGHGLVRVEELTLEGGLLRLYAEGIVTLQGRLDLDVTAATGRLALDSLRGRFAPRIPVVGPIPGALLAEANDLLSRRLLQLRVTGTLHSPSVRVLPLASLRQEAVRFFLGRDGLPES